MHNPDFVKLSESMGAKGIRCMGLDELPAKMKEFLEYDGTRPIVMECIVSSEHVYPMVPAGKALHEQIVSFTPTRNSRTMLMTAAPPPQVQGLGLSRSEEIA